MVSLISKQSNQIEFPLPAPKPITALQPKPQHIIIESGVAIIGFGGSNVTDWTRDSLSFPVGRLTPKANFLSGMAVGSPASVWSRTQSVQLGIDLPHPNEQVPLEVRSQNDNIDLIAITAPGPGSGGGAVTSPLELSIPATGSAVDSAAVTYSDQDGQPVVTFSVAVFGVATFLLRVAYTVHIVLGEPGILVGPGGGTTVERS